MSLPRNKVLPLSHDLLSQLEKLMKEIDNMLSRKPEDKERLKLIKEKRQLLRIYNREIEMKKLKEQMDEIERLLKTK